MIQEKHLTFTINLLVSLFFLTVLIIPKGYNYAPIILSAIGLIYFIPLKKKLSFSTEDKKLIFSFLFYFCTFLLSIIINKDGIREIDNPSRLLLFIPLLLLFKNFPIKRKTILYAIPSSALITGFVALFQKFALGYEKPFPETMHIQMGDISISLAISSLIISIYFSIKKEYKSALFGMIGLILAVSTSALSGARGGWVGFPIVFFIVLVLYRKYINKKLILSLFIITTLGFSTLLSSSKFGIEQRYNEAKSDIINYFEESNKDTSLGARFDMWENALIAIKEAPIFGHGSNRYESFKHKQVESKQMAKTTLGFNSLHNQYLESWVKRGIIGFIGLILVILTPLFFFIRNLNTHNLETKCICILGIIHIVSHIFYFTSQSFLAHNSGNIFYFFNYLIFYCLIKREKITK
ncbi:O-antigen ligase family protein [Haemophilus haemolyticus]|uniref:O-antigen ligase family protein n=1 Tax=Haemophilus haemolyticus TaxID=726 RepID=UPI000E584B95|nr:O-antigen ligase [Haemophilus haemolyticus]